MGVDAHALERAALEAKDREELQQIVGALGGKATSRTRKAELIDQILELTGVTNRPADAPADDAGASAPPAPADDAAPDGDPAAADDPPRDTPDTSADQSAADEVEAPEPAETPAQRRKPARDQQQAHDRAPNGQGHREQHDQGNNRNQPSRDQNGQQGTADPNQRTEAEADDDGESANRRRRRRGRNRDNVGAAQGSDEFGGEPVEIEGYLDLRDDGYGFLRVDGYLPSKQDAYVSVKQARQFGLRNGDHVTGASRPALRNEKNPALLRIDKINGLDPDDTRDRPRFEDLTPLFPDERLTLSSPDDPTNMTARVVDLIAPIGKGQRGMIVSPPKAGKTTIMKQIATSIERNNPEVTLLVLLVDERPEEVTDMRRSVASAEVVASTFDRPAEEHIRVAELALARAMRMVEDGKDVVIILDGITRLARAYNMAGPASGRLMSGGMDSAALYPPKRFFGAARNLEEGGSLTILATALVETGSKMDEVIFEEFKGTGNMELRLDRRLAERRVFPAIDVDASSTRHEELLFDRDQLSQVWKLRRVLSGLAHSGEGGNAGAGLELLVDRMKTFTTNDEFLAEIARGPST